VFKTLYYTFLNLSRDIKSFLGEVIHFQLLHSLLFINAFSMFTVNLSPPRLLLWRHSFLCISSAPNQVTSPMDGADKHWWERKLYRRSRQEACLIAGLHYYIILCEMWGFHSGVAMQNNGFLETELNLAEVCRRYRLSLCGTSPCVVNINQYK